MKYIDGRSYTAEMQTSDTHWHFVFFVYIGFLLVSRKHEKFTFPPVKLFLGFPKSGKYFGHLMYFLPILQCISSFGKNSPLLTFNICIYSRLQSYLARRHAMEFLKFSARRDSFKRCRLASKTLT